MSEFTQCNYCKLKLYRAEARQMGLRITILHDATWGMGGVNIYRHPKEIKIAKIPGGDDGAREKYRISWMMEIGNHCCC